MRGSFPYGAGALARYTLLERDSAWKYLEWQGRHSQTPVVVTAKPHYFRELDVVRHLDEPGEYAVHMSPIQRDKNHILSGCKR